MSQFLSPHVTDEDMILVETTQGSDLIPASLFGEQDVDRAREGIAWDEGPTAAASDSRDAHLRTALQSYYTRGEAEGILSASIVTGFFSRLSADGCLDCTPWQGPYPSAEAALLEVCKMYDVCPLCEEDCEGEDYYRHCPSACTRQHDHCSPADDDDLLLDTHMGAVDGEQTWLPLHRIGGRIRLWDSGRTDRRGQTVLAYDYTQGDDVVFTGSDFAGSPIHADDSVETAASLLTFLSLRPGEVEAEYFAEYTPAQVAWRDAHAEELSLVAYDLTSVCCECGKQGPNLCDSCCAEHAAEEAES